MRVICVGGCSSDSGKTAVVSLLLRAFPGWAAIKVTPCTPEKACPHGLSCGACSPPDGPYEIVRNRQVLSTPGKDTAKFVEAGASKVLWVRSQPEHLREALDTALAELSGAPGVIVESTSALSFVDGLRILVARPPVQRMKTTAKAALKHVDFVAINMDVTDGKRPAVPEPINAGLGDDVSPTISSMFGLTRVIEMSAALGPLAPENRRLIDACVPLRDEPPTIDYLRLSIVDSCDLRCSYCVADRDTLPYTTLPLTLQEITVLVDAFARNGVTKVRMTGGEPLVRPDVVEIVQAVAQTPGIEKVGLTTNGIGLPALARDLRKAGLNLLNISLDTLNPGTFQSITGRDQLGEVFKGIEAAVTCGFEKIKINTVVMRGINDSEVPDIADLANSLPVEVRFIELMPLGYSSEQWRALHVPASEILERLGNPQTVGSPVCSSARLYRLPGGGTVGIISPMSSPFCDACKRIRVTSAGVVKPCLRLPVEENIRPLIGSPDFPAQLGKIIARLSCHKLTADSATDEAIQADAMCLVGG